MSYFILNNIRERPHSDIYEPDNQLTGIPIYDYDDKQARHAFNKDFQEMKPRGLALIFGRDRKVKDIYRVTGTKRGYAKDLHFYVSEVYAERCESLPKSVRYRDFITTNRLSNPNLDPHHNFRRGMCVAHVY